MCSNNKYFQNENNTCLMTENAAQIINFKVNMCKKNELKKDDKLIDNKQDTHVSFLAGVVYSVTVHLFFYLSRSVK